MITIEQEMILRRAFNHTSDDPMRRQVERKLTKRLAKQGGHYNLEQAVQSDFYTALYATWLTMYELLQNGDGR